MSDIHGILMELNRGRICVSESNDQISEYTTKLEATVKESMEAVDLMIKDRDAFHDKNVELEKNLEIAVRLITDGRSIYVEGCSLDISWNDEAENLKGES